MEAEIKTEHPPTRGGSQKPNLREPQNPNPGEDKCVVYWET